MRGKIIFIIILCLGAFSVWYFVPKQYKTTLEGVYYQLGNDKVFERIKIHLDGTLKNRIDGKKTFIGTVNFEGKELPRTPQDRTELELHYHGDHIGSIFSGFRIIDEAGRVEADIFNFGTVYANAKFSQITITMLTGENNRTWSPSNGFMITAPANNREEAIKISQKLMDKFRITVND